MSKTNYQTNIQLNMWNYKSQIEELQVVQNNSDNEMQITISYCFFSPMAFGIYLIFLFLSDFLLLCLFLCRLVLQAGCHRGWQLKSTCLVVHCTSLFPDLPLSLKHTEINTWGSTATWHMFCVVNCIIYIMFYYIKMA